LPNHRRRFLAVRRPSGFHALLWRKLGILQRFDGFNGRFPRRFDGLLRRFDGFSRRLDGFPRRFDGFNGRLTGIYGWFHRFLRRLDGIIGRRTRLA